MPDCKHLSVYDFLFDVFLRSAWNTVVSVRNESRNVNINASFRNKTCSNRHHLNAQMTNCKLQTTNTKHQPQHQPPNYKHQTPHPKLQTPNRKPLTPNPKLPTPNPQPPTPNPSLLLLLIPQICHHATCHSRVGGLELSLSEFTRPTSPKRMQREGDLLLVRACTSEWLRPCLHERLDRARESKRH